MKLRLQGGESNFRYLKLAVFHHNMLTCWNLPWLGIWSVRGEWGSVRSEWGANVWTRVRGQFTAFTYGDPAPWANPAFNLKCCGEKLTHFDPADETFSFRPSVHWNLVHGIFGPLNPPLHRAHVALRRLNGLSENSSQYLSRIYGLNMSSRILWTVYSRKVFFYFSIQILIRLEI